MNFRNGQTIPVGAGILDISREGHIGNFFFPRSFYTMAEQIGTATERANVGGYARRVETISDEKVREGHILGALAEFVALHYCVVFEIPHVAHYLFSLKAQREADFILFGHYRVNVKGVPYLNGDANLLVSRGPQHGNGEECDAYWFMAMTGQRGEVEHFHFKKTTVDQWPVKSFGYGTAAYRALTSIQRRAQ